MTIDISSYLRILLRQRIHPIPQACPRVHIPRSIIVQPRFPVKLLAIELIRHFLGRRMFVHEQFSIGQVGIELGDVGLGVGDVRGAAEVVTMIEEDFLGVGGVCGDIAIPWLSIVWVLGLVPLDGRAGNISFLVELRTLHPTFRYRVVAQFPDDGVVAITRVVGVGRCTLHRRNTRGVCPACGSSPRAVSLSASCGRHSLSALP